MYESCRGGGFNTNLKSNTTHNMALFTGQLIIILFGPFLFLVQQKLHRFLADICGQQVYTEIFCFMIWNKYFWHIY